MGWRLTPATVIIIVDSVRQFLPCILAAVATSSGSATANFHAPPGFRVETVAEEIGSLIAMTTAPGGVIFVSVETDGVLRLVDSDRDGRVEAEAYGGGVTEVQGLVWHEGALFAVGRGGDGLGLYRMAPAPLPAVAVAKFAGEGGGHGPHGVIRGPAGRLYVTLGNDARYDGPSPRSPFKLAYEGQTLTPYPDPLGFSAKVKAPGGTVLSIDPRSGDVQVVAGGLRNVYDLALSAAGDLFAADADMEWDLGLPWYRPVRLLHVVPGGDYGWRAGSGKWPEWYEDSLPSAAVLGRGSPTGMAFYDAGRFPARFHGALFVGDWSRGRILAFHLRAKGATYVADEEVFLWGSPLNVTDLEVDESGGLLFVTGGRGTHGGVYRVVSTAPPPVPPLPPMATAQAPKLTSFTPLAETVALLGDADRFVRFAAVRALERRDASAWQDIALAHESPAVRAVAALTLGRIGLSTGRVGSWARAWDVAAGVATDVAAKTESRLIALRALSLLLQVDGAPPSSELQVVAMALRSGYPSGVPSVDHELALLIARLAPEGAVPTLCAHLGVGERPEQIHRAYALRALRDGWDQPSKLTVQTWLREALTWEGGNSFQGYLRHIERDLAWMVDDPLRAAVEASMRSRPAARPRPAERPVPARAVHVAADSSGSTAETDAVLGGVWDAARANAVVPRLLREARRSRGDGARSFATLCRGCHSYGAGGGGIGPDLTTVGARFTGADLLRALFEPSATIADGYGATIVTTIDGRRHEGRLVRDDAVVVLQTGEDRTLELRGADVRERRPSPRSLMPDGLVAAMTLEEVADLVAFLRVPEQAPDYDAWAWRRIFDGQSLSGWSGDGAAWTVEDGAIVGRARDRATSIYLVLDGTYRDFTLECDVKLASGNSGIQFRALPDAVGGLPGWQADIGGGHWGELYEDGGRGTLARPTPAALLAATVAGEWSHYVVEANGDAIRLELNGVETVAVRDGAHGEGRIGLQLHGAGHTEVHFRNLRLRVPSAAANTP